MTDLVVISPDDLKNMIRTAVREAFGSTEKPDVGLTVPEVARRLGKSEKTIRNWINEGRFKRVSGGNRRPYLISSLEVDALTIDATSSSDCS